MESKPLLHWMVSHRTAMVAKATKCEFLSGLLADAGFKGGIELRKGFVYGFGRQT